MNEPDVVTKRTEKQPPNAGDGGRGLRIESPTVWIESVRFSDDTELFLRRGDIVLIVGPNNSGKSEALRAIRNKLENPAKTSPVVKAIGVGTKGSVSELLDWLADWTMTRKKDQPEDPTYQALGQGVRRSHIRKLWGSGNTKLGPLGRWFCLHLGAEERLQLANPVNNISLVSDPPVHPIHYMQRDDELEKALSRQFRNAFGKDLIVHRNAGNSVPLYVGDRPRLKEGEDRVSVGYVTRLESLPPLKGQGDGMRSFAGVLLATSVGRQPILLIDEPEAFLHPPQARLLGRMVALPRKGEGKRQVFVATHSTDVLRGVLDTEVGNVTVVRLRREANINVVRQLDNADIRRMWSDPLLRYSDILDGVFHEGVVVCEGDSDCRFYSAIAEAGIGKDPDAGAPPDIMFTHCGGKHRLAVGVSALRSLEVPVVAVADFDILRGEDVLRKLVEACGGDWNDIEPDWRAVKAAVDAKKPAVKTEEVKTEIQEVLERVDDEYLPTKAVKDVRKILKKVSTWSVVKEAGVSAVPSGEPSRRCDELLQRLKNLGIFVVREGEAEGFDRTIGGHGAKWVNEVLQRDLATDVALTGAREFVRGVMSWFHEDAGAE